HPAFLRTTGRRPAGAAAVLAALLMLLVALPLQASSQSPERITGTTYVDGPAARALFEQGVLFVDVRVAADYEAGRVPGAVNLTVEKDPENSPFNEDSLLEALDGDRGTAVVLYCNSTGCLRTARAAQRAVEWGFTNIHYYRLGFPNWRENEYPYE
ncbi:MAG: rhodanese-like domain-containing protein, partial [Halothiobacillaceae bacterium]